MQDNFEKKPDQIQKLESGQGAGQSSQFDLSRSLLGGDGSRKTLIPQKQLFKDYISYTYAGPDEPPQHSDATLSRHDAPGQELPMSAPWTLEMIRDDNALLREAANRYERGDYTKAELFLRCVLDNCVQESEPDGLKFELAAHGLAKVYEKQERYSDAEELHKTIIEYYTKELQPDAHKIGAAMKGISHLYEKQGIHNEARAMLKSVLELCKEKFGDNDFRTGRVMKRLAKVYENIADTSQDSEKQEKKYAKADALLREFVLPIYKEKLGENDLRTQKLQEKLADLPVKPGQEMANGTRKLISERRENPLLKHMIRHKRFLDLRDPKLFNDKARHRDLLDRRPIRRKLQNKLTVREYVKEKIGEQYLPKLLCEPTKDPSTISFKDLPDKFVIKSNHGTCSNQVMIVKDKSTINESEIIKKCEEWLKYDPYKGTGKWRYKNIDPYIMVEEYIDDGKGQAPYDYKVFTYNGKPHFVQVEAGRFEDYSSTFHDTNWERLPMTHGVGKNCSTPIDKPLHLKQVEKLAQKLSEDLEFARVDFFITPTGVFVVEISSVPGNGMEPFTPIMYDRIFGEPWTEVYNKCSKPSPAISPDLPGIIHQITGVTYKILEGQRNRQHSQQPSLEEPPLIKSGE
jgi:tetratricopeptide (TPR) repeat protein